MVVKWPESMLAPATLLRTMARPSNRIFGALASGMFVMAVAIFAAGCGGGGKIVPNISGLQFPAGQKMLNLDGFKTSPLKVISNMPAGLIASTEPAAGNKTDTERIKVRVSGGPPAGQMPDATGLQGGLAAYTLQQGGFRVQVVNITSALVPAGRVVRSSPAAGAKVRKGTFVVLLVSGGARTTAVPDLTGSRLSAAKQSLLLSRLGILVLPAPGIGRPGRVGAQSPSPGQVAAVGATVKLWVDEPAVYVTVPRLIGYTGGSASARIQDLHLEPRFVSRRARSNAEVGTALAQSPPAGSSILQGTPVTVVVGTPPPAQREKIPPAIATSYGLRPGRTDGFSIVYTVAKCPAGRGSVKIVPTLGIPYKADSAKVIQQGPVDLGNGTIVQIAVVETTDAFLPGSAEVAIRISPCPRSGSY